MKSDISGFYKLTPGERLNKLASEANLCEDETSALEGVGLSIEKADSMVENVIGTFEVPVGVATNFKINGKDKLIPMATEEPSVIAAASNAAKLIRKQGGLESHSTDPIMVGQIQVVDASTEAQGEIEKNKEDLIGFAESLDPTLVKFGGGVTDLRTRRVGDFLVVHIHVNVADAMGANAVNTMCEKLAPRIEKITGGKVILRILSNYATERLARAKCKVSAQSLGGVEAVDRIINAYMLADADIYRSVTHNKGIMNGVSAVVLATGNDTRAVEAAAHSYACKSGTIKPLTRWRKNSDGDLEGEIELPVAVGLVGGATKTHPVAKACKKILDVKTSRELGQVLAAVGLAQNLAALAALANEGIQRGHMRLHAKNIAVTAGAGEDQIDVVAAKMVESGKISVDEAKRIIKEII